MFEATTKQMLLLAWISLDVFQWLSKEVSEAYLKSLSQTLLALAVVLIPHFGIVNTIGALAAPICGWHDLH